MKLNRLLIALFSLLALAAGLVACTFTAARLPITSELQVKQPVAQPPTQMRLTVLHAGRLLSRAGLAYRGGSLSEQREFGMDAVLVEHPQGNLLFDAGFGARVEQHLDRVPFLLRVTSRHISETPVAEQLRAAGYDTSNLAGIVPTHAHWDHVSGIDDLPGVAVWLNAPERAYIEGNDELSALARHLGPWQIREYKFDSGPYLGFEASVDVYGDGSIVLVPAPGHTPGSIIAFITLPSATRYALVGDLVWQVEGVQLPAERPWLSRWLVDSDAEAVRQTIVHMHQLQQQLPKLHILPAHDRRAMARLAEFPQWER